MMTHTRGGEPQIRTLGQLWHVAEDVAVDAAADAAADEEEAELHSA